MGLGELVRKWCLKLCFRCLPILGAGALATAFFLSRDRAEQPDPRTPAFVDSAGSWISPDGKSLVFDAFSYRKPGHNLYFKGRSSEETKALTPVQANEYILAWSPDSRHVLFRRDTPVRIHGGQKPVCNKTTLNSIDVYTCQEKQIADFDALSAGYSPSGRFLAFQGSDGALLFCDAQSGNFCTAQGTKEKPKHEQRIAWSQDGSERVLFWKDGRLWMFSPAAMSLENILAASTPLLDYDWAGGRIVYDLETCPPELHVLDPSTKKESIIAIPELGRIVATKDFAALMSETSTNTWNVEIADLAAGKTKSLGEFSGSLSGDWNGSLLAFGNGRDVFLYDALRNELKRVSGRDNEFFCRWLSDGRMLVSSNKDAYFKPSKDYEFYARSLDGGLERLTWANYPWETRRMHVLEYALGSLGILAAMGLLGVYGKWRARKRRVILAEHVGGFDKLLDRPGIWAALAASMPIAAIGAPVWFSTAFYEMSNYAKSVTAGIAAATWCAMWSAAYHVADSLSKYKSPCLSNYKRILPIAGKTSATLSLKEFEQYIDLFAVETGGTLANKAIFAKRKGQLFDALNFWNAALQFRRRRTELEEAVSLDWIASLSNYLFTPLIARSYKKRLEKNPDDIGLLTGLQFNYLLASREKKVKELSAKIISMPGSSISDKLLQSFVLEQVGETGLAGRLREEILPKLVEGDGACKLSSNIVYSKPGNRPVLEQEAQRLSFLQQYCRKHDFEAARPLGIFEVNGTNYLFEVFSDGTRLYEFFEKQPDLKVLGKAAQTQAVLHAITPQGESKIADEDISAFLRNTPWQHLPKEKLGNALKQVLASLWKYQAADCDYHRKNAHYTVTEQIAVYDKEPRGNSPVAFDYAKLFRQGRTVGTWAKEQELLEVAADAYNRLAQESCRLPANALPEQVLRASPYKALRFASFAWEKPAEHSVALQFLGNALQDLERLADEGLISKNENAVLCGALRLVEEQARQKCRA